MGVQHKGIINCTFELIVRLECHNLSVLFPLIKQPVRAGKCLNNILWSHWLPVNKKSWKAGGIKSRKKPVYNNNKVKLLLPVKIFFVLPCKAVIQVAVISIDFFYAKMGSKHLVIIVQCFFHLFLINLRSLLIFGNRIGYGKLWEIGKYLVHILTNF